MFANKRFSTTLAPANTMLRILVLFAHPRYEDSIVNRRLVEAVRDLPFVTFHDLYESYPDFDIDIRREQQLLLEHDIVVWHHPLYWYSCPPLLKQWIDLVLEHGWAYGRTGDKLTGKRIFNAITVGGSKQVYQPDGRNRFTINDFLRPFDQTAALCRMTYLPPFVIHRTNMATNDLCETYANAYRDLLTELASGSADWQALSQREYLNIHQYA
jgi:glutathione-regulated potassium-efflux system ancillary protein KefG